MNAFIETRSHAIPVGTSAVSPNLTRPSTYGIVLKYFLLDTVLKYEVRMLCVSSTKCQVRYVSEYERHLPMILIITYLMGLLKDCGDSEFNVGVMNNMPDYAKRQRVKWKSIWLCEHKQPFEWAKDLQVWRFFTWWNRWKRIMLQKGWPNMARFSIRLIILHYIFSFQSLALHNIPKKNLFFIFYSTPATSDPWHQRGSSITNTLSIVSWHFLGHKSSRHLSQ